MIVLLAIACTGSPPGPEPLTAPMVAAPERDVARAPTPDAAPTTTDPAPAGPSPSAADIGEAAGAGCTYATEAGVDVLVDFGDDVFLGVDGRTVKLDPWNGFPRDHYPGPDGWTVDVTNVGESVSACPDDEACEAWFSPATLTARGPNGSFTVAVKRVCSS